MTEIRRAPVPMWRTWLAIALGTVIQVVSFGSILVGAIAAGSDQEMAAGPAYALGFALVPAVFLTVAFVSKVQGAPTAILKAMGLWLVLALPLGLLNPVAGLCAGFAAGATVTLRKPDEPKKWARTVAAAVTVVYVTVLVFILPQAGIFAGAVTPLLAMRVADGYSETRASATED
ncbi:MAG: hypothetical protein WAN34_02375 [Acidimicrobiia bacterium]